MHQVSSSRPADLEVAVLRVYRRIAVAWALTEEEQCQILAVPALPVPDDRKGPAGPDLLLRIGIIVSIYRSLHTIFANPAQADAWIHRANLNPLFGGDPAIRLMCGGSLLHLNAVRDHLEEQFC